MYYDATHTHTSKKQPQDQLTVGGKCNLATVCVFGPTGTCVKDLTVKSQVCYNVQAMNA